MQTTTIAEIIPALCDIADRIRVDMPHTSVEDVLAIILNASEASRGKSTAHTAATAHQRIQARYNQETFFAPLLDALVPFAPRLSVPAAREIIFHWNDGLIILAAIAAAVVFEAPGLGQPVPQAIADFRGLLYREIAYDYGPEGNDERCFVLQLSDELLGTIVGRTFLCTTNEGQEFALPATAKEMIDICEELDVEPDHGLSDMEIPHEPITLERARQALDRYCSAHL